MDAFAPASLIKPCRLRCVVFPSLFKGKGHERKVRIRGLVTQFPGRYCRLVWMSEKRKRFRSEEKVSDDNVPLRLSFLPLARKAAG